ncbi:TetR family transcriptional regulator [Tamaricihabitans halophyticus]|uniref:TetR family transcriptional regulator n=1 Tax=Tamaricihabitans halophyticus TaxID=1262583 RepID=A0A4R2QF97_9PSEU|nr:TetR/AcrR family transcriptional regulator [Tamaricihabitans halophyticus]TCP47802.1 TetR family transcriptional regulator [Tamaricihabitans halophyticus]
MTTSSTERTAATKRKLFEATLDLIGTRGLGTVTVDEIATRAGVAKGTVYYNFGSKDALIEALLRYGVALLADRLRHGAGDAEHAIESIVDAMLGFIEEFPSFAQLLVGELWRTPGQWHATLALLRADVVSIIKDQVQHSVRLGRIPDSVDPATASAALFGTVLVIALDWRVFQPDRTRAEVRDGIMVLISGLRGALA